MGGFLYKKARLLLGRYS